MKAMTAVLVAAVLCVGCSTKGGSTAPYNVSFVGHPSRAAVAPPLPPPQPPPVDGQAQAPDPSGVKPPRRLPRDGWYEPGEEVDDASDVEEALPAVLAECKKLILGMENKSVDQRKASLWVYGIGLVAGTVIAPALTAANAAKHAGAIAGLSALGGASGMAGKALEDSGFGGSAAIADRRAVADVIRLKLPVITDRREASHDRRKALTEMQAACFAYDLTTPKPIQSSTTGK